MSKTAAPRKVGDKEALAVGNTIRGSARKLNLVATMIRGGNPRMSNKLMQGRVVMQAVALVLLALLMLLAGNR